jgi:hypothetical protein
LDLFEKRGGVQEDKKKQQDKQKIAYKCL